MNYKDDMIDVKRWMASRDERMNKMGERMTVLEVNQEHIVKGLERIYQNTRHLVWVGVTTLLSVFSYLIYLIASNKISIL